MIVCTRKSDGMLVGSMSECPEGALITQAMVDYPGTAADDYVESTATEAEHAALVAARDALKRPKPTAAELSAQLRAERNARLTASDWTQMPDSPLTSEQRAAWVVYRQALRDVPGQPEFPQEVSWPVEPV